MSTVLDTHLLHIIYLTSPHRTRLLTLSHAESLPFLLCTPPPPPLPFFFFNDPAPPELYPLPLHDALPLSARSATPSTPTPRPNTPPTTACPASTAPSSPRSFHPRASALTAPASSTSATSRSSPTAKWTARSEEHTSELQSPDHLVCRLLLE